MNLGGKGIESTGDAKIEVEQGIAGMSGITGMGGVGAAVITLI